MKAQKARRRKRVQPLGVNFLIRPRPGQIDEAGSGSSNTRYKTFFPLAKKVRYRQKSVAADCPIVSVAYVPLVRLLYSSSSSSPRTASCLSWYSVIKSRTFLSASWNSISSIPSPLYQWRKAFLLYIAPNWVASRWKMPFKAVVFAMKVVDMLLVLGAVVMTPVLRLFGIHSTKSSAFLELSFSMLSSTSCPM